MDATRTPASPGIPGPVIVDAAGTLVRMASDPAVTLSDGSVILEPMAFESSSNTIGPPGRLSWRAYRLSSHTQLGDLHLTLEAHDPSPIRAQVCVDVHERTGTAVVHGLAQAVRLVCNWAFTSWDLSVITWLSSTEANVRAVMNEAGFRIHPLPHRSALDSPEGPQDAWYGDLTPRDTRMPSRRPLTARENHVLTGMARGRSNHQIALELGISENTVKNHVRSILEVLQTPSRTAAVIEALRTGIVSLEFDTH